MGLLNGTHVNSGNSENGSFSERHGAENVAIQSEENILKNSSVMNADFAQRTQDVRSNNLFAKDATFVSATSGMSVKAQPQSSSSSNRESVSINFFQSGTPVKSENLGNKFDTGSPRVMSAPKLSTVENPYTEKNISRKLNEGVLPAAYGTQRKTVNSVNGEMKINNGQKMRADYTANYARNVNPFNQGNKIVETQRKKFKTLDFDA